MREHRLLQPKRSEGRRRRPGYFQVERPDQLWHLDMTVGLGRRARLVLSERRDRMLHARDHRLGAGRPLPRARGNRRHRAAASPTAASRPGELTLGTDNGTAFTSRAFRARLAELGIAHRRGGYRDPESQAFIESWFSKLKQRCIWREEFETLDEARADDRRLHRPLPPPAPQPAGLPHAARGRRDLERSRRPANPSGLT